MQSGGPGFFRASLWSGSSTSWVNLHPTGATESRAYGITGNEQVGSAVFGRLHAGLWRGTAASWVDLQATLPSNYHSSVAYAIWKRGSKTYIAGVAYDVTFSLDRAVLWTRVDCAVDLNDDGVVDFSDFLEFLNLYDAQDSRADLTGDDVIDFGDYLEFLNQYDAGC